MVEGYGLPPKAEGLHRKESVRVLCTRCAAVADCEEERENSIKTYDVSL